jgi:hypothetical protein
MLVIWAEAALHHFTWGNLLRLANIRLLLGKGVLLIETLNTLGHLLLVGAQGLLGNV